MMEQTLMRLELPSSTYHTLKQMARSEGMTTLHLIENRLQQYQQKKKLHTLRQQYQELIDKDLQRTLTEDEEQRLDSICAKLNAIEMRSASAQHWKRQADAIDAQFEAIKRTIAALPERQARI